MPGLQDVLEKFMISQTEFQVLREVGGRKEGTQLFRMLWNHCLVIDL